MANFERIKSVFYIKDKMTKRSQTVFDFCGNVRYFLNNNNDAFLIRGLQKTKLKDFEFNKSLINIHMQYSPDTNSCKHLARVQKLT